MPGLNVIPQKSPSATQAVVFDFSSSYAVGTTATLASATVTASVWAGVDASPSAIVDGSATVSGLQATQLFTGGVDGVVYKVQCTAVTSDGQTLVQYGYLAVVGNPL